MASGIRCQSGVQPRKLNWLRIQRTHSHPLRCQPVNASGNTSRTRALARCGGGAPPGENMQGCTCRSGYERTYPCLFTVAYWSAHGQLGYFYIWMMSLCLDEREAFHFRGSGVYNCQKPSWDIPAIHILTDRVKWTENFSISWWKVYQKSLSLWCFQCVMGLSFLMMRKIYYYCIGLELGL